MNMQRNRFDALDSLRGVCACLVALGHMGHNNPHTNSAFFERSTFFVDFFFVLSGFVICWNYGHKLVSWRAARDFVILRIGRLYPLHFALLAAMVALECLQYFFYPYFLPRVAFEPSHSVPAIASNLLLLQGMPFNDQMTWNEPSWSISTEFWAYVAFALFCLAVGVRIKYLVTLIAGLTVIVFWWGSDGGIEVHMNFLYARCVIGFACGVICCLVFRRCSFEERGARGRWEATLLEISLCAAIWAPLAFAPDRWLALVYVPIVLSVLVFAFEGGYLSKLLRGRAFLFVGALSYSIYMVHWLGLTLLYVAINEVRNHLGVNFWGSITMGIETYRAYGRTPMESWMFLLLFLAGTIAFSALTYRFIEQPGRRWARRIVGKDAPVSGGALDAGEITVAPRSSASV
jgi:peptidoglycan/LPS O-acetylase OafA/YrhL